MDDKPLPEPLTLRIGNVDQHVATVREAYDLLTQTWPEDVRGERRDEAASTCLKVLDGHRSAVDALQSLREAAAEAGIAVT